MLSANPLIIQSDMTILAEVDSPRYAGARDRLARFAELVKMPEHVHTYRLTPLSLWNACAAGIAVDEIVETLNDFAKFPLPPSVTPQLREIASRFGSLRLIREAEGLLALRVLRPGLADEFAAQTSLAPYLGEGLSNEAFRVDPPWRGPLKRALVKLGWPVEDQAGFIDGAPLEVSLREVCRSGMPLVLRDYQDDAASRFTGGGTAGAGVVVLPCGGGKTIVAIACIARLATHTLILATSVTAARQWRDELLDKTNLTEDDIGEFSGRSKDIKPVTIATYQVLTHRRKRTVSSETGDADGDSDGPPTFSHFDLFDSHPWGLIVYDEVHLLPAPLFQAAASVQSRRRLGLTATLVREDGMEGDVFALVGPKIHEVPWRILEGQGWIAPAVCTEIRIPLPERLVLDYHTAPPRQRPQTAAANPDKAAWVRVLLERHPGESALVIGTYLESLKEIADDLDLPLLDGSTPQRRRDELFGAFRRGEIPALAVSRIANFSIDLPDASVAIQISGQFGSRQEEAQRLGRLLRPKAAGRRAWFYTLVTADTVEQDFALKRQLFLCEQGYEYRLHIARTAAPDLPPETSNTP
jgi:DNA excision repair protein ERCC-3